jgi:hypothetical protein
MLGRFVGQVMKSRGGKANPQVVSDALKLRLGIWDSVIRCSRIRWFAALRVDKTLQIPGVAMKNARNYPKKNSIAIRSRGVSIWHAFVLARLGGSTEKRASRDGVVACGHAFSQ